jgi:multiple sugar transport system permease protein
VGGLCTVPRTACLGQLWGLPSSPSAGVLAFVLYPVATGFWLARQSADSYVKLANDPIFLRAVINTCVFLVVGDQREDGAGAGPVRLLHARRAGGSNVLSVLFILPWAVPSIPTILSFRFMLNPNGA